MRFFLVNYFNYIDYFFFLCVQSRCNKRVIQAFCTKRLYKVIVQPFTTLYKTVVTKALYKMIVRHGYGTQFCTWGCVHKLPRHFCLRHDCTIKFLYNAIVQSIVQSRCTEPLYKAVVQKQCIFVYFLAYSDQKQSLGALKGCF